MDKVNSYMKESDNSYVYVAFQFQESFRDNFNKAFDLKIS